jgi:hypothetical protein
LLYFFFCEGHAHLICTKLHPVCKFGRSVPRIIIPWTNARDRRCTPAVKDWTVAAEPVKNMMVYLAFVHPTKQRSTLLIGSHIHLPLLILCSPWSELDGQVTRNRRMKRWTRVTVKRQSTTWLDENYSLVELYWQHALYHLVLVVGSVDRAWRCTQSHSHLVQFAISVPCSRKMLACIHASQDEIKSSITQAGVSKHEL